MKIISRKRSKDKSLLYYFTGKPCKNGHISKRLTSTGACCDCEKLRRAENAKRAALWKKENPERTKEYQKIYYQTHKNG